MRRIFYTLMTIWLIVAILLLFGAGVGFIIPLWTFLAVVAASITFALFIVATDQNPRKYSKWLPFSLFLAWVIMIFIFILLTFGGVNMHVNKLEVDQMDVTQQNVTQQNVTQQNVTRQNVDTQNVSKQYVEDQTVKHATILEWVTQKNSVIPTTECTTEGTTQPSTTQPSPTKPSTTQPPTTKPSTTQPPPTVAKSVVIYTKNGMKTIRQNDTIIATIIGLEPEDVKMYVTMPNGDKNYSTGVTFTSQSGNNYIMNIPTRYFDPFGEMSTELSVYIPQEEKWTNYNLELNYG